MYTHIDMNIIERIDKMLNRLVKDTQTGLIGRVTGFAYYTNEVDPMVFVCALDSTGRPIMEWVNLKTVEEV